MMYGKNSKKMQDGRAEYYGYQQTKQQFTAKPNKQSNSITKKDNKLNKPQKNQSSERNALSNRRWNAKSETGSSFSSTVSISSRFRDRIEKACSTYSTADFKKEIFLLKRQIERLEKEIFKRDKMIFEAKTHAYENKQSEVQLIQAYRAVHFYEGKAKQMELQIQKFRQTIIKGANAQLKPADLSVLFDELRKQNEQLHAKFEEQSYNLYLSEEKCKKLESKVFDLKRQLTSVSRKYNDPTQKTMTQRFDRMFEMLQQEKPLDLKQQVCFHEMGQKIKELQKKNQTYKIDLDVLQNELEDKNIQITLLYKQNFALKKSRNVVSQKSVQKSGYENDSILENIRKKVVSQQNIKENLQVSKQQNDLQY